MLKTVFSCCLCFLNSFSWHPPVECTRSFEREGKKEEDPETAFEPGVLPEIQEANSQHVNNIKESEKQNKAHDCAHKFKIHDILELTT